MESKELMVVEQLPIIKENLINFSKEIDKEVEQAKGLVCTEESIKVVKEARAKLNNTFKILEEQRKKVKNAVIEPYNDFEKIYKQCVTDKFKSADSDLKQKVDNIENDLKAKKEQEIKDYFEEYKTANNIDFIKFGQARINVTLTASKKSLKEQAKSFIDKIVDDLNLIETQEHKAEILVEYKQTLNVSQSITTVTNRFKAIEEEKIRQEELKKKQMEEAQKRADENIRKQTDETKQALDNFKVKEQEILQAPTTEEKDILTVKFTVRGTKTKLKELKEFLVNGGYDYE